MQGIVEALPELLGTIQAQLLDLLSLVLAGRPYRDSMHPSHLAAYHAAVTHGKTMQMPSNCVSSHADGIEITLGNLHKGTKSVVNLSSA